jgi:hypothetical protein
MLEVACITTLLRMSAVERLQCHHYSCACSLSRDNTVVLYCRSAYQVKCAHADLLCQQSAAAAASKRAACERWLSCTVSCRKSLCTKRQQNKQLQLAITEHVKYAFNSCVLFLYTKYSCSHRKLLTPPRSLCHSACLSCNRRVLSIVVPGITSQCTSSSVSSNTAAVDLTTHQHGTHTDTAMTHFMRDKCWQVKCKQQQCCTLHL